MCENSCSNQIGFRMKYFTFHFVFVLSTLTALVAHSQRQTRLYIDDGFGNFEVISASPGGGTLQFPSGSGTLITSANQMLYGTASPGNNTYTTPGNYLFDV